MTGFARTPVLPEATNVGVLSAQMGSSRVANGALTTANGFPPNLLCGFLPAHLRASTLVLVIGPVTMSHPTKPADGHQTVSTVSIWY